MNILDNRLEAFTNFFVQSSLCVDVLENEDCHAKSNAKRQQNKGTTDNVKVSLDAGSTGGERFAAEIIDLQIFHPLFYYTSFNEFCHA